MTKLLLLLRTSLPSTKWRPVVLHRPQCRHESPRGYVSRAHPTPVPTAPIQEALETLLAEMEDRHLRRLQRWEANKEERIAQRAAYLSRRGRPSVHPTEEQFKQEANSTPYRKMDETISLALQLNLDPRKPGQSLRGSLSLPHGNGKVFSVAVFTDDPDLAAQALERGAVAAGGSSLVESIKNGRTSLASFQRTIACPEIMPQLSSIARLLGPRGLMPTPKLDTVVSNQVLLDALERQRSGISNYRTDREGVLHVGLGRGSFGVEKLMDNVREFMNRVQAIKPESFGKGKKTGGKGGAGKGAKYYLKAHLSATQSKKSVALDLRTIDPTSSFFMSVPQ